MPPSAESSIQIIDPTTTEWLDRSDAAIFRGKVQSVSASLVSESVAGMSSESQSSVVRFEPGAHTVFHTHTGDQILVITEGSGHVGTRDIDHHVHAGAILVIPAGLEHYHGACSDTAMAHLTVLSGTTTLGDDLEAWPPTQGGRA